MNLTCDLGDMRKTLLTISLLSFAALTSACSRHRAATAPSTSTTASASTSALEAAQRESAKLHANADDSGSDEYNLALSQRRAAIVGRYFTDRGIDASRLRITAFGEERPACTT